tara:strand:- start:204 stop:554 length:351 start_codon:yes stop_codon:yes gene_type:complete
MHILNTSTDTQVINIVPRRTVTSNPKFILTDKSTRVSQEGTILSYSHNDYVNVTVIEVTFDGLTEGAYYSLKIKDAYSVIYKGLVYVTDQTDYPRYEVGKGDYVTEDSYDNDFIII